MIRRAASLTLVATLVFAGTSLAAAKPGYPLNLWLFGGAAPTNGAPVDVTVERFDFAP